MAALLAPILGVIAPKGLAPLIFVLGAWGWIVGWRGVRDAIRRRPRGVLVIALAILVIDLWALVSVAWTPAPADALQSWVNITGVALALPPLLLAPTDEAVRRALITGVVLALLAMLAMLAADYAVLRWVYDLQGKDFDPTTTNRRLVVVLLTVWPAVWVLARRGKRAMALGLLAAGLLTVMAGVSNSAQLAVVVALVAALMGLAWPRGASIGLAAVVAVGVLSAPMTVPAFLAPADYERRLGDRYYSGLHRLYIWEFAAQRIADRPVAGWGYDASPQVPGGDEKLPHGGDRMNMHPHNGSLQVWLELGGPGAAAWALLLATLAWSVGRLPGRVAPALVLGQLAGALVIVHLSFGLWQTAWLAALGFAAVLTMAVARSEVRQLDETGSQ